MDEWTLTSADRCDSCGHRAYIRLAMPDTLQELFLCGHHFHDHEDEIIRQGLIYYDERDQLNVKLDASA